MTSAEAKREEDVVAIGCLFGLIVVAILGLFVLTTALLDLAGGVF